MHLHTSLLTFSSLVLSVSAHGIVETIWGGGQVWQGKIPWMDVQSPGWSADNEDYGYVSDVTSTNMTCHKLATPGSQYIPLAAGTNVRLQWSGVWPHPGPVMSYMAKCSGPCTQANPEDLAWFKIAESGLIKKFNNTYEGLYWGSFAVRDNNNTAVVTIPSNIEAGDYVLRHEILALHVAYNVSGAQFYPQCVNLKVSGSGKVQPTGTKATKLYKAEDPGVHTNIYWPVPTEYVIPGPAMAKDLHYGIKKHYAVPR